VVVTLSLLPSLGLEHVLAQAPIVNTGPPKVNTTTTSPSSSASSNRILEKISTKYGCTIKSKGTSKYCLRSQFFVIQNRSVGLVAQVAKIVKKDNKVGLTKWKTLGSPKIVVTFTPEGSREFGREYTPEARATTVAAKMNRNLIRKGKLLSFPLSVGNINKQAVICASPAGQCTEATMLWTLKKANQNGNITARLLEALKGTAGSTIFESEDSYGQEASFESVDVGVEIEAYTDQQFESEDSFTNDSEVTPDSELMVESFESEDDFASEVNSSDMTDEFDENMEITDDQFFENEDSSSFESEDNEIEFTEEDF
jgi:hypothetical protein